MKQKLSVEVMRRKSLGEIVLGAVRIQGRKIAELLGETLSPLLQPEEALPDLWLPLNLYGRTLELQCRRMEDADEIHRQHLTRFEEIRDRRDALTQGLKERFLSLRSTCAGIFGESALAPLGLDFNLAQDAKGVLAQSRIVRNRLRQPDVELVPERWFTEAVDPESMAREFDEDIEALQQTLREFVDRQKETDVALIAKQKTIREHDTAFIPIVRLLESTFRIVGEKELADRVRPTVRRLTRPTEEATGSSPEASSPEASSPEASTPEASSSEGSPPAAPATA